MTTTAHTTATPLVVRAGEGEAFAMLDSRYALLAGAAHTSGRAAFFECTVPATGTGNPPMHVHAADDEAFLVLEGALEVHLPDHGAPERLGPGDFAIVPCGVRHAFRVASDTPARFLVVATAPDFERFVRAVGVPMDAPGLPEPAPLPPPEVLAAVAAEHGITVTGPPVV
jgi:mannose-6-phosphate isomerase-like protein (cupin superfamily)